MFRYDRERHSDLLTEVDTIEQRWGSAGEPAELADPEVVIHPEDAAADDEDEEVEPPGPNVPNYPKAEISDAVDNALDGFQASRNEDVVKTLRQVLNRLEILSDERGQLAQAIASGDVDRVRVALRAVVDWADEQRPLLGE
jgi:hypothetical protein